MVPANGPIPGGRAVPPFEPGISVPAEVNSTLETSRVEPATTRHRTLVFGDSRPIAHSSGNISGIPKVFRRASEPIRRDGWESVRIGDLPGRLGLVGDPGI